MTADVRMYRTPYCGYCRMAEQLLNRKDVAFKQIDCTNRADLRQWIAEKSGQSTVPQIFINGESIGGFTELAALERAGRLDGLLAVTPVALPELPE